MTVCSYTTDADGGFTVYAWNPLAQSTNQLLKFPVKGTAFSVTALATNETIPSQINEIDARTKSLPLLYINHYGLNDQQEAAEVAKRTNQATHTVSFFAGLPPAGFAAFKVLPKAAHGQSEAFKSSAMTITNGVYQLDFDETTGYASKLTNMKSGVSADLKIDWGFYNSSVGGCTPSTPGTPECSGQKSGAYIFRPNSSTLFFPGPKVKPSIEVFEGPLFSEVQQKFSSFATHVIRLYKNKPYVEVEWTAGPIPIDQPWVEESYSNWGKEVVVRYSTDIPSSGTYATDSNGREMVQRAFNKRGAAYPSPYNISEPVAGNYYPVNAMLGLQSQSDRRRQAVSCHHGCLAGRRFPQ